MKMCVKPLLTLLSATALMLSVPASAGILGTAGDYNSFIFNDFTGSSDTEGRLAVGGNATLRNYSVGDKLAYDANAEVLVVGGDLTADYGRVYGKALVGGSASVVQSHGYADGGIVEGASLPIDFSAEQAYLTALSLQLAELDANGAINSQWGGLYLSGDGASDLQVFNLDGNTLLNAHTFALSNVAADATLIFNVSGDIAGLTNMSLESLLPSRNKVLFNFYEASSLTLSGIAVEGSILAPLAHIANPQGVINGTVIASSWDGPMQQNHQPFTGELPLFEVPAPATALLLGFALLALARRRPS